MPCLGAVVQWNSGPPLAQPAARVAGRRPPGAGGGAGRKAGTWGAVQKTLQVITDRTLDAASSRLSSMALGAASLKDSFLVDKVRPQPASIAPAAGPLHSDTRRTCLQLAASVACLRFPGRRAPHARFQSRSASVQGKDAWIAVGGAAVEVATTLDSAVEQLLEGWASPQPGAPRGAARAAGSPRSSAPERCLVRLCATPGAPARTTGIHPRRPCSKRSHVGLGLGAYAHPCSVLWLCIQQPP